MIFIADYTFLTRAGLIELISRNEIDEQVVISKNEILLLEEIEETMPDLIILDTLAFQYDTTATAIKESMICQKHNVLMLSEDTDGLKDWCQNGLKGFISKLSNEEEIILAIKTVIAGKHYYNSELMDVLLGVSDNPVSNSSELSEREMEVLSKMAKGLSSNQIAEELFLSIHTINSHRKNMLKKLSLKSPTQLIVYALENKLV